MPKIVVLYNPPADAAAFDAYYFGSHIPLAKKMPGLRSYTVNNGPIGGMGGPAPYHLIAELAFDSMDDLQQAFASPEGQATAADLPNFAQAGATVVIYDTREV